MLKKPKNIVVITLLAVLPCVLLSAISLHADALNWNYWGDGKAEVASYRILYPRYGELREGKATLITVTETFSEKKKVKSNPGTNPKSDELPVIKFSLTKKFQTGIYDYTLSANSFISLRKRGGRPLGRPIKVSFNLQEWCGHVFAQALFNDSAIDIVSHSYFDGEADQSYSLKASPEVINEDALLFYARRIVKGIEYDESITAVSSLETARMDHGNLFIRNLKVKFKEQDNKNLITYSTQGGTLLEVHTQKEYPHVITYWKKSNGEEGSLLQHDRLAYWNMSKKQDESHALSSKK